MEDNTILYEKFVERYSNRLAKYGGAIAQCQKDIEELKETITNLIAEKVNQAVSEKIAVSTEKMKNNLSGIVLTKTKKLSELKKTDVDNIKIIEELVTYVKTNETVEHNFIINRLRVSSIDKKEKRKIMEVADLLLSSDEEFNSKKLLSSLCEVRNNLEYGIVEKEEVKEEEKVESENEKQAEIPKTTEQQDAELQKRFG